MARKSVKDFSVTLNGEGVDVIIHTENKKPYKYQIRKDEVHPDLKKTADHLEAGLQQAKDTFAKIDVIDYSERMYVTISTPIKYHSDRYTAHKLD